MHLAMALAAALAAVVTSMLLPGEARAQDYPYCAVQGGRAGYENCGYPSYGACMAAVSGVGGHCQVNPRFRGYYGYDDERPVRRKPRRYRDY